jgi:hypothetical protein
MKRTRGPHVVLASLLMLTMALVSILQPAGALAQTTATGQATTTQTAGSASVSFTEVWEYDSSISDQETVFLSHRDLTGTLFIFGEIADQTITDPEVAIEQFTTGFFSEFGDGNQQVADNGVVDQGTVWRLYTVGQSGIPFGMLVTANTTAVPGSVVVSVLVSPEGSFDLAVSAAQEGIDVNGAGSPLASFTAADLQASLDGGGQATGAVTQTPAATGTTPTPGSTGGLTLPPLNVTTTPATGGVTTPPATTPAAGTTTGQTQSVTVKTATVTYGPNWIYQEATSTPDELAFFSSATSETTLFGYAAVATSSTDAAGSLQQFNDGFFGSFGATNMQQVTLETLPSGLAYSLYTADQNGIPLAILAYADVTTMPGEFRVQILISPLDGFDAAMTDTKQSFQIDNVGAFNELDAAQLASLVGGGTTTTPATTTTLQPTATAAGTGGLTLPPLNTTPATGTTPTPATGTTGQAQTVVVNNATISYGPSWTYQAETSTPDQIAFFSGSTSETTIFGYATVPDTSGDASTSLQQFNDGFFGSFGATNVQQRAFEVLPSGLAYSLHTADQGGTPVVVLAYADVSTAPGEFRAQILIVDAASFNAALTDAMQAFQVDGVGVFSQLDPAALTAALGG